MAQEQKAQIQSAIRIAVVVVAAFLILYGISRMFDITLLALLKVLAVPITVGVAVPWLNWLQKKREVEVENQRAQDDALQTYLDQMSEMLIRSKDLPSLSEEKTVGTLRSVARARTLTVLPRLNSERKQSVVQFLYESGLIHSTRAVLDLSGADLSGAFLSEAGLTGANLGGADLSGADLSEAYLLGANLRGAFLSRADLTGAFLNGADLAEADLTEADLTGADLTDLIETDLQGARGLTEDQISTTASLKGATMPNGQEYEDWLKDREGNGEDE